MTVDVEEWYHNCWAPDYVDPARRGPLPEELDRLLPRLLDRLDEAGARATFFVLGEVARRLPERIRELAMRGHEVACHGDLHVRANDRSARRFRRDVGRAKAELEDLLGSGVIGFRAPEWSLRTVANPRLRIVAELGFDYDSSLLPTWGAGEPRGATRPRQLTWRDGLRLVEAPPTVWGGAWRVPLSGWSGRLLGARRTHLLLQRTAGRGELPMLVVHPWELVDRPCPGLLTGFARFVHEAGRDGFGERFGATLGGLKDAMPVADCLRLSR